MRIVISLVVALGIFAIGAVFTLKQPKVYEATGLIQVNQSTEPDLKNRFREIPIKTTVSILESAHMIQQISNRLSAEERERLCPSYRSSNDEEAIWRSLFGSERRTFHVIPDTDSIEVSFRHQNPEVAAIILNEYMRELLRYDVRINQDVSDPYLRLKYAETMVADIEEKIRAIENLGPEAADSERARVQDLNIQLSNAQTRLEKYQLSASNHKRTRELLDMFKSDASLQEIIEFSGVSTYSILQIGEIPHTPISRKIAPHLGLALFAGLLGGVVTFFLFGNPTLLLRIKQRSRASQARAPTEYAGPDG